MVKVCSALCNQIRTQYEKTYWKFDIMWVVSLGVKVHKCSQWWVSHNEGDRHSDFYNVYNTGEVDLHKLPLNWSWTAVVYCVKISGPKKPGIAGLRIRIKMFALMQK